MAVGFPQENADIRIAQYESGTRTPKHELLCRMAQALDITPSALAVPRIRNAEELSSLLSALEDEYGTTFLNEERKQTMKTYAVTITETLRQIPKRKPKQWSKPAGMTANISSTRIPLSA